MPSKVIINTHHHYIHVTNDTLMLGLVTCKITNITLDFSVVVCEQSYKHNYTS